MPTLTTAQIHTDAMLNYIISTEPVTRLCFVWFSLTNLFLTSGTAFDLLSITPGGMRRNPGT